MELHHFMPFQFIKFQNFLQPWWKIFNYNLELDHFKPFPFIKFQNFLQPWLPRIFGNKSPGVEFKSVGVRGKSVGVEFEILLTCLGCGYAMLFKLVCSRTFFKFNGPPHTNAFVSWLSVRTCLSWSSLTVLWERTSIVKIRGTAHLQHILGRRIVSPTPRWSDMSLLRQKRFSVPTCQ